MKINPSTVRAVLLNRQGIQDAVFRAHVHFCKDRGLIDANGLTPAGHRQKVLIQSEERFNRALKRCKATFNSEDWAILIWQIQEIK